MNAKARTLLLSMGLVAATLFLSGCIAAAGTTLHYQLIQCEPPPWGESTDAAPIAAHYGTEVTAAREVDDGKVYAAVCGGSGSRHIEVTVSGDTSAMKADGWRDGPVPKA